MNIYDGFMCTGNKFPLLMETILRKDFLCFSSGNWIYITYVRLLEFLSHPHRCQYYKQEHSIFTKDKDNQWHRILNKVMTFSQENLICYFFHIGKPKSPKSKCMCVCAHLIVLMSVNFKYKPCNCKLFS